MPCFCFPTGLINRTLDEKIGNVDRVYLTDNDLFHLERFASNFSSRVNTYNLLRDRAEELVVKALKLLAQQYPEMVQKHLQRCKYDMSQIVRHISLAVLRDDELFFKESLMDWHTNIIHSYQISSECSTAYRLLQEVVEQTLPVESCGLVKPYLEMAVSAFTNA